MFYDNWNNSTNEREVLNNPNWYDVEHIIKRLDGEKVTRITMDNGN